MVVHNYMHELIVGTVADRFMDKKCMSIFSCIYLFKKSQWFAQLIIFFLHLSIRVWSFIVAKWPWFYSCFVFISSFVENLYGTKWPFMLMCCWESTHSLDLLVMFVIRICSVIYSLIRCVCQWSTVLSVIRFVCVCLIHGVWSACVLSLSTDPLCVSVIHSSDSNPVSVIHSSVRNPLCLCVSDPWCLIRICSVIYSLIRCVCQWSTVLSVILCQWSTVLSVIRFVCVCLIHGVWSAFVLSFIHWSAVCVSDPQFCQ